ncbi:MAG: YdbL family protein [Sphingosinicella sp.]|uniref:YdbL family protein n=1 Tax=Sphingosinicella sp. TaxID=1917971 RepID=UPI004037882F
MNRRMKWMIAAALGLAVAAGGTAYAMQDAAAQLRATGQVGEQADGYLGIVGGGSGVLRSQMEAINIQRRAAYTQLAAQRNATIEEVAAATACQLFATRVGPGQYYRLPDGVWRRRNGNEPVPRPSHCG